MSLRRRFVLVVALSVIVLGASLFAVLGLRAQTAAARAEQAFEQGAGAVEALEQRVGSDFSAARLTSIEGDERAELRSFTASLITPLVDASAGFCTPDGSLHLVETVAPLAFGPDVGDGMAQEFKLHRRPRLLPLDRKVIERACRNLHGNHMAHVRFAAPNDLLFLSLRRGATGVSPFTLVRMPNRMKEERGWGWQQNVALIGLCTLFLVALTVDALLSLRRGSTQIERALSLLRTDLRAEVPTPRIAELARIAAALRVMAKDLGDGRERERDLQGRLAQEQRLSGLGRVVAGVAHEVRNPLAGMKLKLDLLARRGLDERSHRDVATCLEEIARLDRVVSALLLVSRRGPLELARCDLTEVARARLEAARVWAEPRGIRLQLVGKAHAHAHREHLVRVLDNLLRNAIDASPAAAEVTLALAQTEDGAMLTVVDRGSGVPEEHVPKLFEPFFTLKPEGTGLGLFLSRALVEAQHGSLMYARNAATTELRIVLTERGAHG